MLNLSEILYEQKISLTEDLFSDIVKKNPELKDKLEVAKNAKVLPKYFLWLAKVLKITEEPIEDIIPLLLSFEKNIAKLKALGKSTDINSYKTIEELNNTLEDLGKTIQNKQTGFLAGKDILYQDDTWVLAMPRTTEESCELGSGTTWCTARTSSQNLFLSYVARANSDIVLFYIINKQGNPRENPDSKISIGFINGTPVFQGEYGGVTVNAANAGISKERLKEILPEGLFDKFMNLMIEKSNSLKGKHPAKTEMENLIQDPTALNKKLDTFKDQETKMDFLKEIFNFKPDEEIIITLLSNKDPNVREFIVNNKMNMLINDGKIFDRLINDPEPKIRIALINNLNTPGEIRLLLAQDPDPNVKMALAKSGNTPFKTLLFLAQDPSIEVAKAAISNYKIARYSRTNLVDKLMNGTREELIKIGTSSIEKEILSYVIDEFLKTNDEDALNQISHNVTNIRSEDIHEILKQTSDIVILRNFAKSRDLKDEDMDKIANAGDYLANLNLVSFSKYISNPALNKIIENKSSDDKLFKIVIKRSLATSELLRKIAKKTKNQEILSMIALRVGPVNPDHYDKIYFSSEKTQNFLREILESDFLSEKVIKDIWQRLKNSIDLPEDLKISFYRKLLRQDNISLDILADFIRKYEKASGYESLIRDTIGHLRSALFDRNFQPSPGSFGVLNFAFTDLGLSDKEILLLLQNKNIWTAIPLQVLSVLIKSPNKDIQNMAKRIFQAKNRNLQNTDALDESKNKKTSLASILFS